MQKVGTVKFVQIQRNHMKIIENSVRFYRPDPLLRVDKLELNSEGIIGIKGAGKITDVHNENHPDTRYRGDNKISFGFIQQYDRIRYRFDDHIKDGYAGENIIIDAEIDILNLSTTNQRFFFKHDDTLIELKNVIPAPPCREFSVFCLQVPQCAEDIKSALQFLDNGTRGYYAELAPTDNIYFVQAGDELFVSS